MPVYEIIPETKIKGYDIDLPIKDVSISKCRNICDEKEHCEAFVWKSGDREEDKQSKCLLKRNAGGETEWDSNATLYIKRGNPSYWWLWVFLAILGVIVFMTLCKGMKK